MKQRHTNRSSKALLAALTASVGACASPESAPGSGAGSDATAVAESAIRDRITGYLEQLTVLGDPDAAGDYYTADARILGPGVDLDRSSVIGGIRSVLGAGTRVVVNRRTLELFVHGDAAYEIAQAEDIFIAPDGTSADTARNNLFIRWEKGVDDQWRFDRVVLGPQATSGQ